MKAIGIIKITDDLTLKNPSMDIVSVKYSWEGDNAIFFDIVFVEEHGTLKNNRTFEFINEGGGYMSGEDAWNMIANHETLKVFNTEENKSWIQTFINFFIKK